MIDKNTYCKDCERSIYGEYADCDVNIENNGVYVHGDGECPCKVKKDNEGEDDKPTVEPHEIKRERFVVMRNNRTEIWAGLSKNFRFRRLDDLKEVAIKTYRTERQAKTCSSWDRDFEVVPVTEIIRFKEGQAKREED